MTHARARTETWHGLRRVAAHDVVIVAYLASLAGWLVVRAPEARATLYAMLLLGLTTLAIGVVRWTARSGTLANLAYRLTLVGALVTSYLLLRPALPLIVQTSADAELAAADRALLSLDWSLMPISESRFWTEWFSFFYLLYFAVLGFYAMPLGIVSLDERNALEMVIGVTTVFSVGQATYVLVPAIGPGPSLGVTDDFPGGVVYRWMLNLTSTAGAQLDVFPSLHTAATCFVAAHAIRRRRGSRAALARALVLAFIATQVWLATLFLRWHYAVDVVAGIALGLSADRISERLAGWEIDRRVRDDLGHAWP
jgi:hypothetical protein